MVILRAYHPTSLSSPPTVSVFVTAVIEQRPRKHKLGFRYASYVLDQGSDNLPKSFTYQNNGTNLLEFADRDGNFPATERIP